MFFLRSGARRMHRAGGRRRLPLAAWSMVFGRCRMAAGSVATRTGRKRRYSCEMLADLSLCTDEKLLQSCRSCAKGGGRAAGAPRLSTSSRSPRARSSRCTTPFGLAQLSVESNHPRREPDPLLRPRQPHLQCQHHAAGVRLHGV